MVGKLPGTDETLEEPACVNLLGDDPARHPITGSRLPTNALSSHGSAPPWPCLPAPWQLTSWLPTSRRLRFGWSFASFWHWSAQVWPPCPTAGGGTWKRQCATTKR